MQLPAGQEKLRVHRRFFKDSQIADSQIADSEAAPARPGLSDRYTESQCGGRSR